MAEESGDIRAIVQAVVQEFLPQRAELDEAHKHRETLEQRVKELIDENTKSRAENQRALARADEAERSAMVRAELQRQGVAKLDLAYRAIRDEVSRSEDGRLVARDGADLREYVTQFVADNPELLPARVSGGSGAVAGQKGGPLESGVDLDRIRPGMSAEEMERVRQEIARVASQTLRGL
ncbi:MAG TPA: hypothetical protein VGR73_01905 [Bryobacteraceae bacterium]|nr:hypothetical protein [Bryobacteraceae bacterium]